MDQERIHFGSRLKQGREARHLSLGDIARVTKIPERSLERLESGRFDELPAAVFVRGFVRSYARAVGLDADDLARRYGELVQMDVPGEPSLSGGGRGQAARAVAAAGNGSAAAPASRVATVSDRGNTRQVTASAVAPTAPKALPAPAATVALGSDLVVIAPLTAKPKKDASHTDEMRTLSKAILEAGRETRRLPLTLAVIILVIVATLAMSLLLDRPSHIGDGITAPGIPAAAAPPRA